jgi:hypothetical protein
MFSVADFAPGARLCLRAGFFFQLILAGMLLPATAQAQITYTGTAANQNFGSEAIGTSSAARTFSFSVAAGTTVGSIGVLTQGAPNLDFTNTTGSTCAATTYASTTTCTVNVTFKPKFAGVRMGAVVFFSEAGNTGNVLGEVLIYGIGTGPQIAYSSGAASAIVSGANGVGFNIPLGVAVDGAGDVFAADEWNYRIVELPAGGGTPISIYTTSSWATSVAVDGAGNVFTDCGGGDLEELPVGGGSPISIDSTADGVPIFFPSGIAVDKAGTCLSGTGITHARWRFRPVEARRFPFRPWPMA